MTKHYDTNAACYTKERITIQQASRIDADMTICYWLAWIIPGAVAGFIVAGFLLSVVGILRF